FDFGLYGSQPVAVADAKAQLFGASPDLVAARIAAIGPIFRPGLSAAAVRRAAVAAGIGALVVTAQDEAWDCPESWIWRAHPVYAGPHVRILRVEDLDD
ncbi:MAG: hypothetical protein INR70_21685, partial [Parafilimonas terrae]|nr:hypothetical protein [Parafilimonas terrae]